MTLGLSLSVATGSLVSVTRVVGVGAGVTPVGAGGADAAGQVGVPWFAAPPGAVGMRLAASLGSVSGAFGVGGTFSSTPGFPSWLPRMAPLYTLGPPSARTSVRRTIVQLQRPSPQP
jgi:hypothetical protein